MRSDENADLVNTVLDIPSDPHCAAILAQDQLIVSSKSAIELLAEVCFR